MSTAAGDISVPLQRVPVHLLLLFTILLGIDQASKYLVRLWMSPLESIELLPFVRLHYVRNRGIAFGLLEGYTSIIILVGVIIVLLFIIGAIVIRRQEIASWPLALLLAGSCGNLVDRIIFGSVTDFIRVPHWPAFNLADIFIVTGVLLLVWSFWKRGAAPGAA